MNRFLPLFLFVGLITAADPLDRDRLVVEQREFVKTLTLTGELRAVDRLTVNTPRIRRTRNLVISYLAPEGARVRQGDVLVEFDVSELETRRLELEQNVEDARIKIAQTKADIESRRQDLLLTEAQSKKNLDVAQLYIGIDPQLIPAADAEKYQYDYAQAQVELTKARERLGTLAETEQAQLQVVQLDFEQADLELKQIISEMEKLTVKAPGPGLVVYADNPTRAGKFQVGDSVWGGAPVVYLPNMNALEIEAFAYDPDFPSLAEGMHAEIMLDAIPKRAFPGHIESIAESAQPREFRSQLKAFSVIVRMDAADEDEMKPGMTARVHVPVTRRDALVVPRAAILTEGDGTNLVRTVGGKTIPVTVLDASATEASVSGDLKSGDQLLPGNSDIATGGISANVAWSRAEKDSFRFFVSGSGTVEAKQQVAVGPPGSAHGWRFKIMNLVPEGTQVQPGDLLVAFDPTETDNHLREERANLQKVLEELEKTKASEELNLKDLEIQIEDARVLDEKASNKLTQAREFESNLQVKAAEFEARFAALRLQLLEKKLVFVKESTRLQLQILEDRKKLHEYRIQSSKDTLEELTVEAPLPGVVIYETNWRNEKKQIGSDVFRTEKVLSLPDLSSLMIQGQVSEVDAGRLREGQEVEVTVDALPDRIFLGKLRTIGTIFRRASFDRPVKVLDMTVEFNDQNLQILRPGMVAKIEIIENRFRDVLAVPLSAIQVQDGQPYLWVRQEKQMEKRPVHLGENNGIVGIVLDGLKEGEEFASRAPEVAS